MSDRIVRESEKLRASSALHPQEVRLVFRGAATGVGLPTRDFERLKAEAERLGPAYCHAFNEQVWRQEQANAREVA